MKSCGWNGYGQLGVGSLEFQDTVRDVDCDADVDAVACGGHHYQGFSLARTRDGGLLAWGDNSFGQLGFLERKPVPSPRLVTLPRRVVAMACGTQHAVVVLDDGSVMAWGDDSFGQLPKGSVAAVSVACGDAHTLLLTGAGDVVRFGSDELGQLGGSVAIEGAVSVACGQAHSLVLLRSGSVLAFGCNASAQLGLPKAEHMVRVPTVVHDLPNSVVGLSCGIGHSLVVTSEGACHGWGSNEYGQLGEQGGALMCPGPVVVREVGVLLACAGGFHSVLLMRDGFVWSAGCKSEMQRAYEGLAKSAAASETHTLFVVE